MKPVLGILIALIIGAACRWFGLPVPAPPRLYGALLVVAITVGYLATDRFLDPPEPAATVEVGTEGERQVSR